MNTPPENSNDIDSSRSNSVTTQRINDVIDDTSNDPSHAVADPQQLPDLALQQLLFAPGLHSLNDYSAGSLQVNSPETVIVHLNSYAEFLYYFDPEHNPIVADMVKCVYSDWGYHEKMYIELPNFLIWRINIVLELEHNLNNQLYAQWNLSLELDSTYPWSTDPLRALVVAGWREESRNSRHLILHKIWRLGSFLHAATRERFNQTNINPNMIL
ncbi:hypothetical protein RUND412_010911, partial [Rhizina undulata]